MSDIPKRDLIDTQQTTPYPPTEAYQIILNWLKEKGAEITDKNQPGMIKAKQGKKIYWKISIENEEKNITFLINEHEEGSIIRAMLDTPWYNKNAYEIRQQQRDYYNWLAPLWSMLDTEPEEALQEDLFGATGLYKEQINATKNMYISAISLLAGIAVSIWSILNRSESQISTILFTGGSMGLLYSWNNANSAKRKIDQLEPEQKSMIEELRQEPNPIKSYKYLTAVALIIVIAFGAWAYTQPPNATYTGDGYSFQYPRYYKATLQHEEGLPQDRYEYVECDYEGQAIIIHCLTQPDEKDPEVLLDNLIAGYEESFTISSKEPSTQPKDGKTVHEAELVFTLDGEEFKLKMGTLYVQDQDRLYIISYLTDETSTDPTYQEVLDSFQTN